MLIKFLVYQWDLRQLQGSRVVYIFVEVMKSVYVTSGNNIIVHFVHFKRKDTFYSDNKWCAQRFIEFTDEQLEPKVQIEDGFIFYHGYIGEAAF